MLDLAANYKASYHGAIAHFLDRLEDGRAFETAPEDNLEALRMVESACRAGDFSDPQLPTTNYRPRAPDHEPLIHRHEATSP